MRKDAAEFVVSAYSWRDFPRESLPEIVLAGRSNVGKSSLINKLSGSKRVARIGSSPGTTRSVNFYRCKGKFMLVDLPGYGYATAGRKQAMQWKRLVEDYFRRRRAVALVLHLVDSRLQPSPLDKELQSWMAAFGIPYQVVATKADKLSGNGRSAQTRAISQALAAPVVMCSAVTGLGCNEIWKRLADTIRDFGSGPSADSFNGKTAR